MYNLTKPKWCEKCGLEITNKITHHCTYNLTNPQHTIYTNSKGIIKTNYGLNFPKTKIRIKND